MVTFFTNVLKLMEELKGTAWAFVIPGIVVAALVYAFIRWIVIPSWKGIRWLIDWRRKKRFSVHESLRYMQSSDVYYAIDHYIPTRYSANDPARNEEPIPEYMGEEGRREPLLLEHFLKYEFDQRHGGKFYLVLGDCGMGKTTFLINLFYVTSRKHKNPCAFVSLVNSDCLEQIKKIPNQEKTILMLDALDESDAAMRDFGKFIEDLESEVRDFYRVIITSRTNFFTNAEKENLFHGKSGASTMEKISSARKYYIAPFTDEDVQHYLHQRYRRRKMYRQAWNMMEANKNLSVRPMLLRYMDDIINENTHFSHSFQLYEYLFRRWIAREAGKTAAAQQDLYDECLTLAMAMYYQWMKDGRVGIMPTEIDEKKAIPGLSAIRFQGHAILNRTAEGMYKFAHRSFWEYLVARLALKELPFSDDLFIQNFEQAEVFLNEMIAFADSVEPEADPFHVPAARLGTANFYLKYWRPEEAEKILREVLEKDEDLTEEQDLFARVHLIRAFRYQWKEASAEKLLLPLYKRLEKTKLTVELAPQFAQFGWEIAQYSYERKSRIGQELLMKVIDFCKVHPMPGYALLRCWEAYCRWAPNYAVKEAGLSQMWRAINMGGSQEEELVCIKDEYADYLYSNASLLRNSYTDEFSFDIEKKTLGNYEKFMDAHMRIKYYINLALSAISVYNETHSEGLDYKAVESKANGYLNNLHELCCSIYNDREDKVPHNPYKALAHEGLVKYYRVNSHSKDSIWQSENLKLLDYRVYAHLENEMQIRYCKILDRASENESIKFSQRESYLLEYLNFARAIGCRAEEISALWGIYLLYDEAKEAPSDGQEQLKAAYDLARTDSDYKETPNYCWMLQVMIDYYKGAIDKKAIYRELKEIAPGIFGSDVRRKRIYRCLENYASQAGDAEAIDFEVECLRCEFDQWELGRAYDACVKFADEARFLVELEKVLREMPKITTKEETIIEEFLKDIVDSYNRQKELEKRFDELFGNALKNSAKSDEVDADSNKSNPLTSDTDNKLNVDSSEFVKEVRETVRHVKQEKERERFAWVQSKRRISTL